MTTDRRYTTDRPWPYPRGRAALIDQVINAYQYVLCFDDGTREPGYFSGHRELEVGERVRAFASRELHAWEIQLLGANAEVTPEVLAGLVAVGRSQSSALPNVRVEEFSSEDGWGSNVVGSTAANEKWVGEVSWHPSGDYLLYGGQTGSSTGFWGIQKYVDGEFDSEIVSQVAPSDNTFIRPIWSPSGDYIALISISGTAGTLEVYRFESEGVTLADSSAIMTPYDTAGRLAWSRDGAWIAIPGFESDPDVNYWINFFVFSWDEGTETLGSAIAVDNISDLFLTEEGGVKLGTTSISLDFSADGSVIFSSYAPSFQTDEDSTGNPCLVATPWGGSPGTPIVATTPTFPASGTNPTYPEGTPLPATPIDLEVSPDGRYVACYYRDADIVALHEWDGVGWGSRTDFEIPLSGSFSPPSGAVAWFDDEHLFIAGKATYGGQTGSTHWMHKVGGGTFDGEPIMDGGVASGLHGSAIDPHPALVITGGGIQGPLNPVDSDDIVYTPPTPGSGNTPPGGSLGEIIDVINGSPSYPLPDPIPIPEHGFEWEELFPNPLGFQTENPVCDEVFILDGTSSGDISNLRAAAAEGGVCILVQPDLVVNLGSNELEVNHHTALIGLGHGFDIVGRGIVGENKHHVLLRNFEIDNVGGGSSGDGINFTDPGSTQIRIDMVTLGIVGDEQIDLWEGVGRVTVSRVVFRDTTKQDFGFLIGVPPEDLGNNYPGTLITMYECVGYTEGRWPLFKLKGRLHMVNCVKPRWGYEAIKSEWGIVRAERNWFGPAGGRAVFQVDNGGSIQSIDNWFDGVANPGSLGSGTFTPPYTIGTPMSPARKAQILSLAGKGAIPLMLPEALEGS